jgi:hypothetical protein
MITVENIRITKITCTSKSEEIKLKKYNSYVGSKDLYICLTKSNC